jgi:hypothetical protein
LAPVWKPIPDDLVPPNQDGHVCIVANCAGIADVHGDQALIGFTIPNDDLTKIDICNDPQQGQLNITILPVKKHKRDTLSEQFGFLSGIADAGRGAQVVLDIVPLRQGTRVDAAVLSALQSGPFRDLSFRPVDTPLKRVALRKNPHECRGWLAKVIREAEAIVEDGTRLGLTLPPNGLQPLVFEAEMDPSEAPGTVHVFDVIQTDQNTGQRGGYRIAVVAVP